MSASDTMDSKENEIAIISARHGIIAHTFSFKTGFFVYHLNVLQVEYFPSCAHCIKHQLAGLYIEHKILI